MEDTVKTYMTHEESMFLRYILQKPLVDNQDLGWLVEFAKRIQSRSLEPEKSAGDRTRIPRSMDDLFKSVTKLSSGRTRTSKYLFDADGIAMPSGLCPYPLHSEGEVWMLRPCIMNTAMYTVARALYMREYGKAPSADDLLAAIRFEWDTGWNEGIIVTQVSSLEQGKLYEMAVSWIREAERVATEYYTGTNPDTGANWKYYEFARDCWNKGYARFRFKETLQEPLPATPACLPNPKAGLRMPKVSQSGKKVKEESVSDYI